MNKSTLAELTLVIVLAAIICVGAAHAQSATNTGAGRPVAKSAEHAAVPSPPAAPVLPSRLVTPPDQRPFDNAVEAASIDPGVNAEYSPPQDGESAYSPPQDEENNYSPPHD